MRQVTARVKILFDVRLAIGQGELVTLLGRNGMGKTTTIRCIMGLTPPLRGAIEFANTPVRGWLPEAIARRGVGLVPEGRQVFPLLTVEENLVATAANRLGLQSHGCWRTCIAFFHDWTSDKTSTPGPCPVVSSRCWRSAAR